MKITIKNATDHMDVIDAAMCIKSYLVSGHDKEYHRSRIRGGVLYVRSSKGFMVYGNRDNIRVIVGDKDGT